MPANLAFHQPIGAVETTSGLTPFTASVAEKAGQVFKIGVPVQLNAGFVQEWDGATLAAAIAGFSLIPGSNLGSNGKGAPGAFSQIGPPGTIQTYGSVPNQPSAVNIAVGAPITDGRTLFESSVGLNIFEATYDNSAGAVAADYTPLQSQIGTQAGLTKDANGQWYVDGGKVTAGTNTVVVIVGINPIDQVASGTPNVYIVNARVRFQVLAAARQDFI
jgi:hypothetical protein